MRTLKLFAVVILQIEIKALQALSATSPLCLFLLLRMFWHKKYQRNYQFWSTPTIILQDIEHKHNSKINQGP